MREWREGWPLVLAAMAGISTVTLVSYVSGLIIAPLESEFGWSRAEITSGLMINSVLGVVLAPFAGILIDRIGPRRIGVPGLIVFTLAFAALCTVSGSLWHWWALWLGIAIGALMLKPTVWTSAVSSRFDAIRGTALAVALLGTGLTGILAPIIGGLVLNAYGWRAAVVALPVIWLIVAFPLCYLYLFGAQDLARQPGGPKSANTSDLVGLEWREAMCSRKFIFLALSILLIMPIISGVLVHLIPFFIGSGLDPLEAAALSSVIGVANMVGRLSTGFLLDRFSGTLVSGVAFALPAVLMVALLGFDGSIAMAVLCAALLGLSAGAELDIAAYLTSRHFGVKSFGVLFGTLAGIMALAMGIGPFLLGTVYDRFGDYDLAFQIALPMALLASVLVASLGRYDPRFAMRPQADDS
jgi:MFS family permease